MDPALLEILRDPPADREVEAVLRLQDPVAQLPGVRVVARFGSIITCRIPIDRVTEVRGQRAVASLKAPRLLAPERVAEVTRTDLRKRPSDARNPGSHFTGRGSVIGFLDWGFAYGSRALRHPDGRTRLLALWDQRRYDRARPNRYGYGTIHDASRLNEALRSVDPYRALGYHPAQSDALGIGAHATHCIDIAAGNGLAGGPVGVAPEADLVCVHLATDARGANPLDNLGDSVRVIEGIDFIRRMAAGRPFVISASIGRHGGPHDGSTLAEMCAESVSEDPNCIAINSGGNYFAKAIHASGRLRAGESRTLRVIVDPRDSTPNEIEIWHDAHLALRIVTPHGLPSRWVALGERAEVLVGPRVVARVYSREGDPQNGDNLIDIFIEAGPPAGEWLLELRADQTPSNGATWHAWIERDDGCAPCQARFHPDDANSSVTTSTLANASQIISVGAYDAHDPGRAIASFSSAGPTRRGLLKPDLVAPGVRVLAARSPAFGEPEGDLLVRRSGTSMAAPHVSGCAAVVLEASRGTLGAGELREILLSSCDPADGSDRKRFGHGYLNIERAIATAQQIARRRDTPAARSFVHLRDSAPSETHMSNDSDTGNRVLDLVNQLIRQPRESSADDVMRCLLEQLAGVNQPPAARRLFRSLRGAVTDPVAPSDRLRVVARPLEPFDEPIRPGDVMLRRALGEGGLTHVAVTAGPEMRRDQLEAAGLAPEDDGPGWFVQVVEAGPRPRGTADRFARRVRDANGRGGANQFLLRFTPMTDDCGCGHGVEHREDFAIATEQAPPAPPAAPDSAVANAFVLAHADRWCSPGAGGSATCAPLANPRAINRVVIHVLSLSRANRAGTDAQAVIAGWQAGGRQASSHYIVDHDGTITQMVRENDVAFHAGDRAINRDSIGIEHGDVCNDPARFGTRLYERSAQLVRDIAARHGFAANATSVIGHDSFGGANGHDDPGPYWDWPYYIALLAWDGIDKNARPVRYTGGPVSTPSGWRSVARRAIAHDRCATTHDPYSPAYLQAPQTAAPGQPPAELSAIIEEPGYYRVALWWPYVAGASTQTPVDIELRCMQSPCVDSFGYSTVVDQSRNFGRWNDLGTKLLVTSAPVEIRATIRRDSAAHGTVIADSLRCLRVASVDASPDSAEEGASDSRDRQNDKEFFRIVLLPMWQSYTQELNAAGKDYSAHLLAQRYLREARGPGGDPQELVRITKLVNQWGWLTDIFDSPLTLFLNIKDAIETLRKQGAPRGSPRQFGLAALVALGLKAVAKIDFTGAVEFGLKLLESSGELMEVKVFSAAVDIAAGDSTPGHLAAAAVLQTYQHDPKGFGPGVQAAAKRLENAWRQVVSAGEQMMRIADQLGTSFDPGQ